MNTSQENTFVQYVNKVQYMQDQLKGAAVGSLSLQIKMYQLYAGALVEFKRFYKNPEDLQIKMLQQLGRMARKVEASFDLSVKQLSAFRHFCVLVPAD